MRPLAFTLWFLSSSLASACSNIATIEHRSGSQTLYFVEIADGLFSRARGLMFRDHLAAQSGMLFVYEQEVEHSFWMKNVSFPLDIIFAGSDGRIISIHRYAQPYDETQIRSRSPFASVLEINAGASKSAQIKLGDQLSWKRDCASN